MRFTAQEEYGLRCLLQLARREDRGPLTINDIGARESLTPAYVGKLMRILQQGDLVVSARGPKGGYRLARPSDRISLGDVLRVLDGSFYTRDFCDRYTGNDQECVHVDDCSIRSVWSGIERLLEHFVNRTMLSDLVRSEPDMNEWIREPVEELKGAEEIVGSGSDPSGGRRVSPRR
jgi:Rrf2 family protein